MAPFSSKSLSSDHSYLLSNLMTPPNLSRAMIHYQKAGHAFLLRQYDAAHVNCLSAINELSTLSVPSPLMSDPSVSNLRRKLWALYVNFVTALLTEKSRIETNHPETKQLLERPPLKVVNEVWARVVEEGYGGEDGEVDGEVIVACILLCLSQQLPKIAREIIESWFYSIPEHVLRRLDHVSANGIKDDSILKCYEKTVELYALHVLPRLKDWEFARNFLRDNNRIDGDRRKAYEQTLNKLQEVSNKPKLSKPKHKKSKKDEVNGRGNGFLNHIRYTTRNFIHTNGAGMPSTFNGSAHQKHGHSLPSPSSILVTSRTKNNHSQRNEMFTASVTTKEVTDAMHNEATRRSSGRISASQIGQYLWNYLNNFTLPKIVFVCLFIILYNGYNGEARQKILELINQILAKIWQTVKAGTTII